MRKFSTARKTTAPTDMETIPSKARGIHPAMSVDLDVYERTRSIGCYLPPSI